ncbi:hypothetical protein RN02_21270 [Pseudomonas sp. PI1]|jgi:hypothetical protein|nr:hypothetical protein RN02_21270 [Pseudomonas sp. PI1]
MRCTGWLKHWSRFVGIPQSLFPFRHWLTLCSWVCFEQDFCEPSEALMNLPLFGPFRFDQETIT